MSKPVEIELEHVIGFTGHNLHTVTASRLDPKRFYYPIGSVIVDASLDDPHDQRFMTGHDAEISTIVPSSSGRLLASGQEECRTKTGRVSPILVWDATSRKLIYTLQGHTSGIIAVAWSSDDRFIVSSGKDGRLCIWDVETGACVGGHRPSESPASFLQWVRLADPTSRRPVYNFLAGYQSQVKVYSWAFDVKVMQFNLSSAICSVPGAGTGPGLVRAYPCAALDISTNYCFAGTGVGEMVVYNIPNHLYRVAVPVCSNGVTAIAVSPVPRPNNVTVLYVSGGDGSLRKLRGYDQSWEVLREARIGSKISSLSLVPATSSSGDDSELIAATADGRIFRVLCGDLLFTEVLQSHTAAVGNVSFEKSRSDMLVSASLDGSIRTWDLNTYLAVTEIRVQDKQMQGTSAPLCTFPIGDCVLSGWSDGYVRCHDSRTGRLMWQIVNAHRGKVQAICVTDVAIVTAGEDRHVRVWSLRSHELVVQFSDHQRPITAVAADVRADKPHLLYSVGLDRCMTTYDLRKQRREKSHSAGESGFNCLAQRKCADFEFLCGAGEGRIVMLDEDIPQPTKIFATGVGQVRAVAVSPSGKWLATGCDDGVLRVWDALKLECICEGVCHSEPLLTLTWTPDEKQIVSGGADCSICVWNVYEN